MLLFLVEHEDTSDLDLFMKWASAFNSIPTLEFLISQLNSRQMHPQANTNDRSH
jgi:hypothetical protein